MTAFASVGRDCYKVTHRGHWADVFKPDARGWTYWVETEISSWCGEFHPTAWGAGCCFIREVNEMLDEEGY